MRRVTASEFVSVSPLFYKSFLVLPSLLHTYAVGQTYFILRPLSWYSAEIIPLLASAEDLEAILSSLPYPYVVARVRPSDEGIVKANGFVPFLRYDLYSLWLKATSAEIVPTLELQKALELQKN